MSAQSFPSCHMAQVAGPQGHRGPQASVWICEYPYRTMRASGPSSDCADCPIWQDMQRRRGMAAEVRTDILVIQTLVAS